MMAKCLYCLPKHSRNQRNRLTVLQANHDTYKINHSKHLWKMISNLTHHLGLQKSKFEYISFYVHISVDLIRHHNPSKLRPQNESIDLDNKDLESDESGPRTGGFFLLRASSLMVNSPNTQHRVQFKPPINLTNHALVKSHFYDCKGTFTYNTWGGPILYMCGVKVRLCPNKISMRNAKRISAEKSAIFGVNIFEPLPYVPGSKLLLNFWCSS